MEKLKLVACTIVPVDNIITVPDMPQIFIHPGTRNPQSAPNFMHPATGMKKSYTYSTNVPVENVPHMCPPI
jgi:hypothetical protein